jgi:hypothetical protein
MWVSAAPGVKAVVAAMAVVRGGGDGSHMTTTYLNDKNYSDENSFIVIIVTPCLYPTRAHVASRATEGVIHFNFFLGMTHGF